MMREIMIFPIDRKKKEETNTGEKERFM